MKSTLVLLAAGCLVLIAAPAPIGMVKSVGSFRVNGSAIAGNGTLFEGDQLETSTARSVVQLGVTRITLLPESRAHIFHDHTVLEKGSELLSGGPGLAIEAATLRVSAARKASMVQVEISAPNRVSVGAREGGIEVRNSAGLLIARLSPGVALAFEPQSSASTAVKVTGKVESIEGQFFLADCTTGTRVELRGTDLRQYAGKPVTVAASDIPNAALASGVTQVVQVVAIAPGDACKINAPVSAGARAGSVGGGKTTGATSAIIRGVAVAGTVVSLAAETFNSAPSVLRQ